MFLKEGWLKSIDFGNLDTSQVTNMQYMFNDCTNLTRLDMSQLDMSNVEDLRHFLDGCIKLTYLDLSNFDPSKVIATQNWGYFFQNCNALTHIKCKQSFKDFCLTLTDTMSLPETMQSGGSVTWEIVE